MKKIKGKEQPYLQWTENGKSISKYIKIEDRETVFRQIERRKQLKAEFDQMTKELFENDADCFVAEPDKPYMVINEQPLITKKATRNSYSIERNYINSKAYHDKFEKLPVNKTVYERLYIESGRLLEAVDGTNIEKMIAISARTGKLLADNLDRNGLSDHTSFTYDEYKLIEESEDMVIVLHNHSYNRPPSGRDIATYAKNDNIKISLILCHDGDVYAIISAIPEVYDIYELFYEEIKPKFGEDIAKAIATTRLEKLNVNNKLYEIRRL